MESLAIFGVVILIPIGLAYFKKQEEGTTFERKTEEISVERFDARIRQERIMDGMNSQEKRLFREGYQYKPTPSASEDDPCVKATNICTTVFLVLILYFLIGFLSKNPTWSLKEYL